MKSTIPGDLLKIISDNCSILQQPEAAMLVGSKRLVKNLERKKREMRSPQGVFKSPGTFQEIREAT